MQIPEDMLIWLVIAVILGILEIFTVGFFFAFFAAGALIAAFVSIWSHSPVSQIVVFLVSSIVIVALARPVFKRMLKIGDRPQYASNVDALIGTEVLVIESVDTLKGRVKVAHTGEIWSAYLSDGTVPDLEPMQLGVIEKVDGAKLVIRPKSSV